MHIKTVLEKRNLVQPHARHPLLADAAQGGWQSEDEKEITPDRAALLWIVGRGLFSNGSAVNCGLVEDST